MGCWGIRAFESDAGLDAVDSIRQNLPADGKLELKTMLALLQSDDWCSPPEPAEGHSHTSPMALAELMVKFMDQNLEGLDYDDPQLAQEKKFASITSFTADRESIQWVKKYLSATLRHSRIIAEFQAKEGQPRGGWFDEKDWFGWQTHMEQLIGRMDQLLCSSEPVIQLIRQAEQKMEVQTARANGPQMG